MRTWSWRPPPPASVEEGVKEMMVARDSFLFPPTLVLDCFLRDHYPPSGAATVFFFEFLVDVPPRLPVFLITVDRSKFLPHKLRFFDLFHAPRFRGLVRADPVARLSYHGGFAD